MCETALPRRRRARIIVPGLVLLAYLLLNVWSFGWDPPSGYPFWPAVAIGLLLAQVNLIAIWTGIVRVNGIWRLPVAFFLMTLLWATLMLGLRGDRSVRIDVAIAMGTAIFGGVAALQIPLAFVTVGGWQLVSWRDAINGSVRVKGQFDLWQLLGAIALIAVSLAIVRARLPAGELAVDPQLALMLLVALGVFFAVSVVTVLPCVWVAFVREDWIIPAVLGWLASCFVVCGVLLIALVLWFGAPARAQEVVEGYTVYFTLLASQGGAVLATLLIFRWLGCQLRRIRRT